MKKNKILWIALSLLITNPLTSLSAGHARSSEVKLLEVRTLAKIHVEEGLLELSDGSVWQVSEKDKVKIAFWKVSTPLNFTVSEGWVSGQECVFTNLNNKQSVSTNLYKAPESYNQNADWIAYIEPSIGTLFLHNGAKFCLYSEDAAHYMGWKEDDFILIGTYNAFFTPYKHLVFNYRTKQYAFAMQL